MSRKSIAIPVVAALVLLFAAAAANANKIAYSTWSGNQIHVMVMDDSGANPTEVYRFGKFSIGGEFTISPPGSDGTWVAIEDYDLWKVRADGTDLIKMLCYEGTDKNGDAYNLFGNPQWSPDGSEILVQTGNSLALLPATFTVGEDCVSPLKPIHCYDWGEPCVPASYWNLEGSAAWNDDGSKIAFFENLYDPPTDQFIAIRLVILGRENNVWAPLVEHVLDPNPVESDISFLLELDWQRDGSVLAFVSREETGRRTNFWLTWIDAATGVWDFFTEDGSRIKTGGPSWSPDGSQLIFTDSRGHLVKWTYLDGSTVVVGSGEDPDWQRDLLPTTCETDQDCNDGNECTSDSCNQTSGECSYDPVTDNTTCSSGAGICCGGLCSTTICQIDEDCNDNDVCTDDSCYNPNTCNAYCNNVFDLTNDPSCECLPKGEVCISNDDCCSNKCRGNSGSKKCK